MKIREAFIEVYTFAYKKVRREKLLVDFYNVISTNKFLNKKQTILQGKEVPYDQIMIDDLYLKIHFSDNDFKLHTERLINSYTETKGIKMHISGKDVTLNFPKEINNNILRTSYSEYLNSPHKEKIDYLEYLDIKEYVING